MNLDIDCIDRPLPIPQENAVQAPRNCMLGMEKDDVEEILEATLAENVDPVSRRDLE